MNALDELLGRRVSMRAPALLRVATGPIVLLHLRPFLDRARAGFIYRDAFYEPYATWYPELPRAIYLGLLWLGVCAAIAMTVGLWTRVVTVTTFGVVGYNLFLSTTHFHNNRAYLLIVLAGLSIVPCGRELSCDAWLRRARGWPPLPLDAPAWPLWLLRFEAGVIYGASGFSKLVDSDWFGGNVTWDRMVRAQERLATRTPLPDWVISVLTDRSFHTFAAKVIVATELVIAVGLWSRRTRYATVWLAVVFHLCIEASASVQIFTYLAVAALVIWAVPSTRDRVVELDSTAPAHRRLRAVLPALDWLARFRIEPAPPGSPLRVIDRDGRVREGAAALAFVGSRLPPTAFVALPMLPFARPRSPEFHHLIGGSRPSEGREPPM